MRHLRRDYEAIQPWPIRRPHHVKTPGGLVLDISLQAFADTPITPIIPVDEPVFLLRAIDPASLNAMLYWCSEVAMLGGDPVHVERVQQWAAFMRRYALEHGTLADVPTTPAELLLTPDQF